MDVNYFIDWIDVTFMDVFHQWRSGSIATGIVSQKYIGIGTSNPQAQLHVVGDVRIDPLYIGDLQPDGNGDCRILTLDSNNHIVVGILP